MPVVDFPVGAPADVAELEYISALHQICSKELRLNATTTAEDIRYYLVSRHGIRRDSKEIDEKILQHLAASHELSQKVVYESIDEELHLERQGKYRKTGTCEIDSEGCNAQQEYAKPQNSTDMSEVSELHSNEFHPTIPEGTTKNDGFTSTVMEESTIGRSGTHEIINGFFSFFPDFLGGKQLGQDTIQPIETNNTATAIVDVETSLPSHDRVESSSGEVPRKRISLLAYVPRLGEEDEWENLAVDEKHMDRYEPIDMVQQVAMLCIPELIRAQKTYEQGGTHNRGERNDSMAIFEVFLLFVCNTCQFEPGIQLTKDMLVEILNRFGEAWPEYVVDEMWHQVADEAEPGQIPLLTAQTLMKALTKDIQEFPTDREFLPSTHWNDVMSRQPGAPLDRIFTASNLDYTADTYSSFWWANLAWLTLVITIVAYLLRGFTGIRTDMAMVDCESSSLNYLGCRLINGIILWVEIFVELAIIGFPFIYLSTMGNSVYAHRESIITYIVFPVGMATVVFYTVVWYSVEFQTKVLSTEKLEGRNVAYKASLVTGVILLLVQIGHFLRLVFPPKNPAKQWFKSVASGMERMERWTKLSASFKVQKMLANALFCHCGDVNLPYSKIEYVETENQHRAQNMAAKVIRTFHGDESFTLLRFQGQVDIRISGPNKFSIWRRFISKQLQKEQGIWLSPRLGSSNLIQWFIVLLIPFAGNFLWVQADKEFDALAQVFAGVTIGSFRAFIIVGGMGAFAGAANIAISYVPGAISLTMQFRTGMLGSLRDKEFLLYRKAQETRTMLYGATVWGLALSIALLWLSFGSLAFFISYEPTQHLVTSIVINFIGFIITWLIKEILLRIFRFRWYRGFYRRKPANANILNIIMDCWNLGFSSMFIVARFVNIFLCLTLNLGRVDVPFLSMDVAKVGPLNLDGFPISYRKDLLIHEAHRHPYLERLGLLYLLKLRLGPRFGSRAGGVWRVLFVLSVMPWLKRYRKTYMLQLQAKTSEFPDGRKSDTKLSASQPSSDDRTVLLRRNEELERENAFLKYKVAHYELTSGRGIGARGSIFTGSF